MMVKENFEALYALPLAFIHLKVYFWQLKELTFKVHSTLPGQIVLLTVIFEGKDELYRLSF